MGMGEMSIGEPVGNHAAVSMIGNSSTRSHLVQVIIALRPYVSIQSGAYEIAQSRGER
jgi:hypothetical protein